MTESTISLRVDKHIHQEMKKHDEINWSAVLRKSILQTLTNMDRIDSMRATAAVKMMNSLQKTKMFIKGKTSVEVIREWREKRK